MYRIASLDTETLSLSANAAIAEIGVAFVDLPEEGAYEEMLQVTELRWGLPLLEQLCYGRDISVDTLQFHARNQGIKHVPDNVFVGEEYPTHSVEWILNSLKSAMERHEVKEIWMNHPAFDSGRLHSLSNAVSVGELWHYRLERDIATIRDVFKLKEKMKDQPKGAHRGVDDALWNLEVLRAFGNHMKGLRPIKPLREDIPQS